MNNKNRNFELDFIGNLYRLAFFLATEKEYKNTKLIITSLEKDIEQIPPTNNKTNFYKLVQFIKTSFNSISSNRDKQLLAQQCLDRYNILITQYTHAEFA